MLAALFWRRSNKWGALAATLWVAARMSFLWWLQLHTNAIAPTRGQPPAQVFPALGDLFLRAPSQVTMFGYVPVMFMCLGAALWMTVVSLLTRPPSAATVEKFFPSRNTSAAPKRPEPAPELVA